MRRFVLFACLLCLAAVTAAQAAPVIYTLQPDGAPVTITKIWGGWIPPDWAPAVHKEALKDASVLPLFMQYTSQAQKPIDAIRFMCAFYDPFNDYLDSIRLVSLNYGKAGTPEQPIQPGALDYGRWRCPGRDIYLTSSIIIYPGWVRFDDGTVWRADQNDVVKRAAQAQSLNFEAWHVTPEPKEYVAQLLKDALPKETTPR